jgi:hypothetical protein
MEPPRVQPPPPPAAPFDPSARPKSSGCPKPLVIGCLVLLILAGVGFLGFFYYVSRNMGKMMNFSLQQSETAILAKLSKDVTPEERRRLEAAFDAARQRFATTESAEEIPQASQTLNSKMVELVWKKGEITRQEVQELTRVLEEVARKESPPASP